MKKVVLSALLLSPLWLSAQTKLSLTDLSDFNLKSNNWSIVGDVNSSLTKENTLISKDGKGILLCKHTDSKYGEQYDLLTKEEYGDMDLSLDFMLGKGSNSGIYLQGRYEIQLFDSWGVTNPKYYDCGGIYQRRDLSKPDGQNQYEGYAPRYNAYKAPGLWNNIQISYQAPRFDATGKKIANAKILSVKLNGLLIHENVELSGPTGGPLAENEVPFGPLRIQGDHGSVAFRNIEIKNYNKKSGSLSDLNYKVYYGSYMHDADLSKVKVNEQGNLKDLTWEVTKESNNYVFVISGKYNAPEDGDYTFETQMGGHSYLKIDGKMVLANVWNTGESRKSTVFLKKGIYDIEIFNNKRDGWIKPTLGLWSSGPGFRSTAHHIPGSVLGSKGTDPIIVSATTNTNLRSFMDWKKKPSDRNFRVVHAISVGSPGGIHYTYDLDKGAIIQAWKGNFLDTTPMWDNRGDGSSRPLGSLTFFDHDLVLNPTGLSTWKADTTGTHYRPLGYDLDENDLPTFNYKIAGQKVTDKIRLVDDKFFARVIKVENGSNLLARLASADKIEKLDTDVYSIDDKQYIIKILQGGEPQLLEGKHLVVKPVNNEVKYAIIF